MTYLLQCFLVALGLLASTPVLAQPAKRLQIERMTQLGKLWGKIKYYHPYLAYKEIDWER